MSSDKRALRILFDTYWSPKGWKSERSLSPDDFAYARLKKYMFDSIKLTHDEAVRRLLHLRSQINLQQVADAFVASLTTRRLELRSALGSFAYAAHFPDHELAASTSRRVPSGNLVCEICGNHSGPGGLPVEYDLNILSFERFKWGGVRHSDLIYACFDLDQFAWSDQPSPSEQDYAILSAIIELADTMPGTSSVNDLKRALSKLFPSNDAERRVLVECLAMCGVLTPAGRPGFLEEFSTAAQRNRDRPSDHKNDWAYPAIWWRGTDRVNRKVVTLCFPQVGKGA